jgi:hypothetical protein
VAGGLLLHLEIESADLFEEGGTALLELGKLILESG